MIAEYRNRNLARIVFFNGIPDVLWNNDVQYAVAMLDCQVVAFHRSRYGRDQQGKYHIRPGTFTVPNVAYFNLTGRLSSSIVDSGGIRLGSIMPTNSAFPLLGVKKPSQTPEMPRLGGN